MKHCVDSIHSTRGTRGLNQVLRISKCSEHYLACELLAYHWHPRGKSPVVNPHLHVRANIQLGERWLGKVHLPTGAIELEDIVSLAVNELAVEPLREDWERLIHEAGAR